MARSDPGSATVSTDRCARIAITGLGWCSALGTDAPSTWRRLCAGEVGIRPISRFDASAYPAAVGAEIRALPAAEDLGDEADAWRWGSRFFLSAAREAIRDAGVPRVALRHAGVAVGVSVNYLHMGVLREAWRHRDEGGRRVDLGRWLADADMPPGHHMRRTGQHAAAAVARRIGAGGPCLAVDTACAASLHALIEACRLLRHGRARAMIVGGASGLIYPMTVVAFGRLGALSPQRDPALASRPFDRERDGFVLGEGAAALVVERMDDARRRGARVLAEVAGVGASTSGASLTDPSPAGAAEARAIRLALEDGGVAPAGIDYVAAHGTSTPKNDVTETMALKSVFGAHAGALAVSSVKGQLGHTVGAAGVVNVVAATLALRDQRVPPTATLRTRDPACDLDYVPGTARPRALRAALVNAFAFGGQNASVVLRAG